jgi:hypothetical protein
MTAGILLAFSPLFALVGFWTLVYAVINVFLSGWASATAYAFIGGALIVFAPFGWAIGFLMDRAMNHRFTHPKQFVTIREMLFHPFTVHSPDPAYSDLIVDQIRERLAVLKAVIIGSAEMRGRRTYEL